MSKIIPTPVPLEAGRSGRLIALGFDEPGGITVLNSVAQGIGFPVVDWWAVDSAIAGCAELPSCRSLELLTGSRWPLGIPRPDVALVDSLLFKPDRFLLVAGMMLERYRHVPESYDSASSFSRTLTHSGRVLAFWIRHLEEAAPSVVLFSRVPHDFSDYLAYVACKRLGISVLMLRGFQVGDLSVMVENLDGAGLGISKVESSEVEVDLPKWLEGEIEFRKRFESPSYMLLRPRQGLGAALVERSRGLRFCCRASSRMSGSHSFGLGRIGRSERSSEAALQVVDWAQRKIVGRLSAKRLNQLVERDRTAVESVLLSGNFVYCPLHLQPEATSSPLAAQLVDQRLLIESAAVAARARGLKLVVKENPKQIQHFRGLGFWEDVGDIDGVLVVSGVADTFSLISGCQAVVTINGTAGWEAQFHGRGAAVHYSAFYGSSAGAYMFRDLSELDDCLQSALEYTRRKPATALADIRQFLYSLSEVAIERPQLNTQSSSRKTPPPAHADLEELGEHIVARIRQLNSLS